MCRSGKVVPCSEKLSAPKNYFKLPITMLLLFGISPINNNRNLILKIIFCIYFWFIYLFIVVLNTVSKGMALQYQNNLDDLAENISFFINHAIAMIKISIFMVNRNDLMRLINTIEGEKFRHKDCSEHFSANRLIRDAVNISETVYCSFIFCLSGLILNSIINAAVEPSSSSKIKENSHTNVSRSETQYLRALPFHSWYPFPIQKSPYYEIVFAYQIIALLIVGLIVLALDSLVFGFMIHLKVQFRILSHNLRFIKNHAEKERKNISSSAAQVSRSISNQTEDNLDEIIEKDLERHVKHHQAIIQMSEDLESVFTYQLLLQFICSLLAICMLMWQVSNTPVLSAKFASMLSHMLATAFQLFMYCWFGNEMMLESLSVAEAAWNSGWHEIISRKYSYGVAMIIRRSQKVIMISAGGFIDLTLETFMMISQTAYSCFAVLKKIDS